MTTFESDTIIAGSHLKPNNRYGQNGYPGPSSDLPGQHTTSGFLPKVSLPAEDNDGQTRKVSAQPYAPASGMKAPNTAHAFPTANVRRVSVPANPKSFQR